MGISFLLWLLSSRGDVTESGLNSLSIELTCYVALPATPQNPNMSLPLSRESFGAAGAGFPTG